MIEDLKNIKSTKKELKEFGLTIGIILVILGLVALLRNKDIYPYFLTVGIVLVVLGLTFYKILLPLQKIWMGFSVIIGFFASRIILTILFYAVLTPIGIVIKLLGKDILDERIDKEKESYWHVKDASLKEKTSYENQY